MLSVFTGEIHFSIEIYFQLMKLYVDGIMREKHVKYLCTELKNDGKYTYNDDHAR
jgi:hypothetical protein